MFDTEVDGLPGLPNVVLMLNDLAAVTDSRGDYVFPSVPPGEYLLSVDQASIESERVPSAALPRRILVVEGEESVFEFGVTRPGCICGAVIVDVSCQSFACGWGISGTGGPPALFVEARCGNQVLRQLTNADGCFTFDGLRPGRWKVVIDTKGLPRYHSLDQDTFVVDVERGVTEHVEAKVGDHQQNIPIIDTGDVRLSDVRK